MADQSVRGRFVWHELVTPDADAAHAFYGKAIGWKPQPWEEDASYVMFAAQRGPIGAAVAGNGSPSHWLPYIGTADIDATIELAKQKGGSVVKDVETMSSGSRHAVLQDPYGARFGVYESAEDYGKITPPQPGEHSWHELVSTDHEGAFDFYAALFGWENIAEHDMGEMGKYLIYGVGDARFGGMLTMTSGPQPNWLSYVHVKDVNQTAKKVKSAGGQVINGPMEVPGGDWIVVAVDPQGAMFAAHATAANMKKSEKKERKVKPEQLKLDTETPPPAVQDPETPAEEQAPPVEEAPPAAPEEKPAKKRAPAKKAPPKEAPPAEAPAEEAPAKRAPAKRKSPAKKAPAKKAPAKKAPAKPAKKSGGKKSGSKKSGAKKSSKKSAARGAGSKKTAAKKGAKKAPQKKAAAKSKTRSGGKKKAAKKPRKGK
jgi:predicted enzyme related to lactoylglutathione lyase